MKTRCKPEDRCVVVAEVPGCECNIGALVTVTSVHATPLHGRAVPIWRFRDASRPLKVVYTDLHGRVIPGAEQWVLHSNCTTEGECDGLYDFQLVPVHGEGEVLLQETREEQPA